MHVLRWFLFVLLLVHGLIHLLGAAKGFGWAAVDQLTEPISASMAWVWLAAAVLVLAAAVLVFPAPSWWWALALAAAVVSQIAVISSWSDAKAGTIANVVLLIAAVYAFAAAGPASSRAEVRRVAAVELGRPHAAGVVTEADLAPLPEPVARWVRWSGAVGRPRVSSFLIGWEGRLRATPSSPWITFTGTQLSTVNDAPARLFFLDARMKGLPVDVLHEFVGDKAEMRVRLLSLLPMARATGPEMHRSDTVTLIGELCALAPAAILDVPIRWDPIDSRAARLTYTLGPDTVQGVLTVDDEGRLVEFASDDRTRSSADGKTFTSLRWTTPIDRFEEVDGRRIAAACRTVWHAPAPEGTFGYGEFTIRTIDYNVAPEDVRA